MAQFRTIILLLLFARPLWAQEKNPPRSSSSQPIAHAESSALQSGAVHDGVYHNAAFGFSYKLPFGWVDRTADMQDSSTEAARSRVLLALFERPPEASGDTVNSAVVIAAEPLPAGMKTAAQYFESLSTLAAGRGFEVKQGPSEFSVGATKLVRGDFSKTRGTLTMYQTSLVMLEKSYAVSITFIGGSEDEVSELIEKLSFAARKPTR